MLNKKKYQYRELTTNETVEDFMARHYALEELGIEKNGRLTIEPRGKDGTLSLEQMDFIEETIEWFFSGNWIKEEVKED